MKNILLIFFFLFGTLGNNILYSQNMSDDQIISYVKEQSQKGTSQQEIAKELVNRGVTPARLQQIQQKYKESQVIKGEADKSTQTNVRLNPAESEVSEEVFMEIEAASERKIFGRDLFNNKKMSFEPDVNIPTPVNYVLGPNDEVVIDIWGASQMTIHKTISPEGRISIDNIGPVYLNGMTVEKANEYLQNRFSNVFAGVGDGSSQINLTIGRVRTIQVSVMGEVVAPGNYAVSSLSTVFHALYRSGGISDIGSLRKIKVYRNGELLKTLDMYQYILQGKIQDDIRLNDKDVIIVPTYDCLVDISGKVKRPMLYEMKSGETISDLVDYAGGFVGDAYTNNLSLTRMTGEHNKIFTVNKDGYGVFKLEDGDLLSVASGLDLFENRVEIKGAIFRDGFYEIGTDIKTLKDLIGKAGGVRGDAFLNRAVILREKDDLTTETISIDVRGLLSGAIPDVALQKNDVFYIPSIGEITEGKTFTIDGEVPRPGTYMYADNTTLEDLIIQAGGLLESASLVRIDIARRISNPYSTVSNPVLSETFSFELKDGLIVDGNLEFVLEPYDHVYVRRSPDYYLQQNVELQGEVTFPGRYALNKKTERISDVVKRAGNLTSGAYAKGAKLIRKRTAEEISRYETVLRISTQGGMKDSISLASISASEYYDVGIELDQALKNPGSEYDLVLREGDRIIIPEFENTVKINGAVMYPNTVFFKSKEKVSYYINQSGGYLDNAIKNKVYVIYQNGTVSRVKGGDKNVIQPGCEIIVPTKDMSKKATLAEVLSVGSTVTSMASVVTMLIYTLTR